MRKQIISAAIFLLTFIFLFECCALGAAAETDGGSFVLDNQNRYAGMDNTYSEGYVPKVENGYAKIVVPVLYDGTLKDSVLRASVTLGDTASMPFVCKNYEKSVKLADNKINNGDKTVKGYLINFDLELKKARENGSYPVTVSVSASSDSSPVNANFTVYVIIKDGTNPKTEPAIKEEAPVYLPKIMIQSYKCSEIDDEGNLIDKESGVIQAGKKMRLTVTLVNTSKTQGIKNMTVSIAAPGEFFTLRSPTDSLYIESLGANKTKKISYDFETNVATPAGQYDMPLSYDYAYNKGMTAAGSATAKVRIVQALKIEFDPLQLPGELTVSDVFQTSLKVMNLGRATVYNVRAVIEADGIVVTNGTAYIGDIEAGMAGTADVQISVSSLTQSETLYGKTSGKITYYYEDSDGKEYTEEKTFSTTIKSPFASEINEEPEDKPGQWWIIMPVILLIICALAALYIFKFMKLNKDDSDIISTEECSTEIYESDIDDVYAENDDTDIDVIPADEDDIDNDIDETDSEAATNGDDNDNDIGAEQEADEDYEEN